MLPRLTQPRSFSRVNGFSEEKFPAVSETPPWAAESTGEAFRTNKVLTIIEKPLYLTFEPVDP